MVTERADVPSEEGSTGSEDQGILDLTTEGQDSPSTGTVDDAPVLEDTTSTTEAATQAPAAPVDEVASSPEESKAAPTPSVDAESFTQLRDQVKVQEERLQHYQELEQRAQMRRQVDELQQHYQTQGYDAEQATQLAQGQMRQYQERNQIQQQAENQRLFYEGRRNAAIHYAKEFSLGIDDMIKLEQFNTPQEMELEAKNIAEIRDLKNRLAKYEQSEAPPQSFDNNQPSPSASASQENLLQDFAGGSQSPEALRAIRNIMGM